MSAALREIAGSWGTLWVDADGYIVNSEHELLDAEDIKAHNGYRNITRFDIAEYIAWCNSVGHPEWAYHDLDILEVGFWEGDKYEPAKDDFRNDFLNFIQIADAIAEAVEYTDA